MSLFKELENAKQDLRLAQDEIAVHEQKLAKDGKMMDRTDFDALTQAIKTLKEGFKAKQVEVEIKQMEYNKDLREREEIISTANADKVRIKTSVDVLSSPEYLEAWAQAVKTGDRSRADKLLSTTPTDGTTAGAFGATIPTQVATEIEKRMMDYGQLLAYANIMSVAGLMKFSVALSNTGASNHAEGTPAPAEEEITLGEVFIDPQHIKKWISWTDELEIMSAVNLGSYLVAEFVEEIAKKVEYDMLYGAMDNKGLQGIVTEATTTTSPRVGVLDAQGAFDFQLANAAIAKVRGQDIAFFMNRETYFNGIANIADTTNRPLYGLRTLEGRPSYNGVPVFFTDAMKPFDVAAPTDAVIVLVARGAYKINAPKGLAPTFIRDGITLAAEDRVRLIGKVFVGGTLTKLDGAMVITKGTAPVV